MSDSPTHPARRALRLAAIYMALIVGFVLVMTLAFSLPRSPIMRHVRESFPLVSEGGFYPRPFIDHAAYQLDNYTDSLMLDIAMGTAGQPALNQALADVRGGVVDEYGDDSPLRSLNQATSGVRSREVPYARYWHGYQAVLRPALYFFTYGDIRVLNLMFLTGLVLFTLLSMRRQVGRLAAICLLASLLTIGIYVVPMSLQFSSMVYLALCAVLVVLLTGRHEGSLEAADLEIFFVVGMLTAFLDLLTAPVLTLGLPLATALILRSRDSKKWNLGRQVLFAATMSALWAVGYLSSWCAKWLIASWVLGSNIVFDATSEVSYWMNDQLVTVARSLKVNLMNLLPTVRFDPGIGGFARYLLIGPTGVAILIALAVWIALVVIAKRPRAEILRASAVLIVVPLPYLWLAVTSNHSLIHYSFTYRVQAGSVFAVLFFLGSCIDYAVAAERLRTALGRFTGLVRPS